MILIQGILIVAFLALVGRFLANPNSHQMKAWQKIFAVLFFLVAIFSVLLPDDLNTVAHFLGVGRGADLLLYLLTLAFIFLVFNLYVRDKQNQVRVVSLTRRIAIIDANQNPHNQSLPGFPDNE
jgi:hypothetical protein